MAAFVRVEIAINVCFCILLFKPEVNDLSTMSLIFGPFLAKFLEVLIVLEECRNPYKSRDSTLSEAATS